LQDAHAINIFHADSSNDGYPQVTDEAIIAANSQFILLTEDPRYGGDVALVYRRPDWNIIDAVMRKVG
jgi:iron complex transport system substrate-binding protein